MASYESFLFLIGSVFLPLFGVVSARYIFDPSSREGKRTQRTSARAGTFASWLVGFAVYHWILPTGPAWWTDGIADVAGTPIWVKVTWLPASIPAFGAAFVLQAVLTSVWRRRLVEPEVSESR